MPLHRILLLFLLSLHLPHNLLANQPPCPGGQLRIKGRCVDCPAGTFRRATGANKCIPCPPGKFNPLRGAGSQELCRFCAENTFASEAGAIACQPCPKDTVANYAAKKCKACGPGFQLNNDNITCEKCFKGTYNNKTAALQCVTCEKGSAPEGATSANDCKPCPPGTLSDSGFCSPCLVGRFLSSGMCDFCPQGSVAKVGANKCRKCPPGTFSRGIVKMNCLKCPPGFTSNGPGASRCRPVGSKRCPKDTFENANGDCDKCRPGDYMNVKTRMCERCPPGFVSKGGLQTKCDACLPGQTTDYKDGAECFCPAGMWRAKNGMCRKCPPGTGDAFDDNKFGREGCRKCAVGKYSNTPGSTECKQCPVGTFAAQEGSLKCTPCPPGTISNPAGRFEGAGECVSIRTGCPLSEVQVIDIDFEICKPRYCKVGTPKEEIGISCTPCSPGFYLKNGRCVLCKSDEVSPGGIVTSCTKCENGFTRTFSDFSKCDCDGVPNEGKGIQNGVCKDCPPGMSSDSRFSVCIPCQPGSFASKFRSESCRRCPPGTYSDIFGSTVCKKCPLGTKAASPTGAKECVPSV